MDELELSDEAWTKIASINRTVNAARWVPEEGDSWNHMVPGDCENCSWLKRKLLVERGAR